MKMKSQAVNEVAIARINENKSWSNLDMLLLKGFVSSRRDKKIPDKLIFLHPETGEMGSLIGGIFKEIAVRLKEAGGYGASMTESAFDEERLKYVYDCMLREANVETLYHTYVNEVVREHNRIAAVKTVSKEGQRLYRAHVFVDATGDGDLAAMAGCPWSLGRPTDQLTQAMTVSFRIGNVDKVAMQRDLQAKGERGHKKARMLVDPYFQRAIREGQLHFPYREWIHFYDYPHPGVLHFNMTRINQVNGL